MLFGFSAKPSEFGANMGQLTDYLGGLVIVEDAKAISMHVATRQTLEVNRRQSEFGRAIATQAHFYLGEPPIRVEGRPCQRQSWAGQLLPHFQELQIPRKQLAFDQFAAYDERFRRRFRPAILPADAF